MAEPTSKDWRLSALIVIGSAIAFLSVGSTLVDQTRRIDVRTHSDARWNDLGKRIDNLATACSLGGGEP